MNHPDFFSEHFELTRRFFLRAGVLGLAASQLAVNAVADESAQAAPKKHGFFSDFSGDTGNFW